MINTAIIPAAGKGTRLLPFTKEIPKEMMPLYFRKGMMPVVQIIFEQLYDCGIRNFIFIVGIGKRAIEDHFTPDSQYIKVLKKEKRKNIVKSMEIFYKKISKSQIAWINQSEPKGFGDAVLHAESYIKNKEFIVHAGDACIMGKESKNIIKRILEKFENNKVDGIVVTMKIKDKSSLKQYGIVTLDSEKIINVVEKPKNPKTDISIMPIYAFTPKIFLALKKIKPGVDNEIQLTDGIQNLIKNKNIILNCSTKKDKKFDVGTPKLYFEALKESFLLDTKH